MVTGDQITNQQTHNKKGIRTQTQTVNSRQW